MKKYSGIVCKSDKVFNMVHNNLKTFGRPTIIDDWTVMRPTYPQLFSGNLIGVTLSDTGFVCGLKIRVNLFGTDIDYTLDVHGGLLRIEDEKIYA